jgi:curved DNA-binding protein CbpA
MYLKDYYQVLELPASASIAEIKSAYRRLALVYHPDKHNNDPYANERFADIKEAYEILTDPGKKEYYLQQRWYQQSMGRRKTQPLIIPVNILKQSLELEKYVSRLDLFRMDKYGLHDYIATLVDNTTIEKLNGFNEPDINAEIVLALSRCIKVLPLDLFAPLHQQLKKIKTDELSKIELDRLLVQRRNANQRDRIKIWVIILTVILLCLLIFFLAEN